MFPYKEHDEIWLEPICPICDELGADRLWSQDDMWTGACQGCGAEVFAVRYVLALAKPELEEN